MIGEFFMKSVLSTILLVAAAILVPGIASADTYTDRKGGKCVLPFASSGKCGKWNAIPLPQVPSVGGVKQPKLCATVLPKKGKLERLCTPKSNKWYHGHRCVPTGICS